MAHFSVMRPVTCAPAHLANAGARARVDHLTNTALERLGQGRPRALSTTWLGTTTQMRRTGPSRKRRAQPLLITTAQSTDDDLWKVRVVTFDLDDTLWPTAAVVLGANSELQSWISANHPKMNSESSALQATISSIRRENEENIEGYRVFYGKLRESAICRLALEGGYDEASAKAIGAEGFKVWLQARQDTADALLFRDAVDTLKALKQNGILIGAITNGCGDPRQVSSLAPFFDFFVSAEEPEVSRPKPAAAPFEVAAKRLAAQFGLDSGSLAKGWVHVGDCLRNDVEAAKRAGLRTVHYAPPEDSEYPTWKSLREANRKNESSSSFAVLSSKPMTQQEVDSISDDEEEDLSNVDAQINQLIELVTVVENWNEYCCASAL